MGSTLPPRRSPRTGQRHGAAGRARPAAASLVAAGEADERLGVAVGRESTSAPVRSSAPRSRVARTETRTIPHRSGTRPDWIAVRQARALSPWPKRAWHDRDDVALGEDTVRLPPSGQQVCWSPFDRLRRRQRLAPTVNSRGKLASDRAVLQGRARRSPRTRHAAARCAFQRPDRSSCAALVLSSHRPLLPNLE